MAHAHHLKLDPQQAIPFLTLLSEDLKEFKPPSVCPTGVFGNVVIYDPQGHKMEEETQGP